MNLSHSHFRTDLDTVLDFIQQVSRNLPIVLVGFSLGAISLGKV